LDAPTEAAETIGGVLRDGGGRSDTDEQQTVRADDRCNDGVQGRDAYRGRCLGEHGRGGGEQLAHDVTERVFGSDLVGHHLQTWPTVASDSQLQSLEAAEPEPLTRSDYGRLRDVGRLSNLRDRPG